MVAYNSEKRFRLTILTTNHRISIIYDEKIIPAKDKRRFSNLREKNKKRLFYGVAESN